MEQRGHMSMSAAAWTHGADCNSCQKKAKLEIWHIAMNVNLILNIGGIGLSGRIGLSGWIDAICGIILFGVFLFKSLDEIVWVC